MRYLILILSFLFLKTTTHAATDPIASYWANDFGMRLAKIKKSEDIMKNLNFSGRHQIEIQKEIERNVLTVPDVAYKIYITQVYMIDAKKHKTVIDFANIKNKKLALNGKMISLNPNKSYEDYLVEVEKILNPPKKASALDLFVKDAYAQSGEGSFARWIATVFTSASAPRYLESDGQQTITSTLIKTYENEADRARQMTRRGQAVDLSSLFFYCEGKVLTQVVELDIMNGKAKAVRSDAKRLISIPGGGYELRHGQAQVKNTMSCSARVDDNGLVTEVFGANPTFCPRKDMNIFNEPVYFGGFPKAAAACCQKEGCYEEVVSNIKRIRGELTGRPTQGLESSDAKTAD